MKNRCHSCKHWTQDEVIPGMGRCSSPKFVDGTGVSHIDRDRPTDGVYYLEQYEWYPEGFLRVGKDFGCIHWTGDRAFMQTETDNDQTN